MRSVPSSLHLEILERVAAPAGSALPPPRLLLVLAHPDDEVLALGARLERLTHSRLLTITDGTPTNGADALHHGFASLDAYRAARHAELVAALGDAQLPGTLLAMAPRPPVPDQTAALDLPGITRVVANAIFAFQPEAVLTHPYEGGHPDHDACAFAVHHALHSPQAQAAQSPQDRNQGTLPVILETPFYHAGKDGSMRTGGFLPEPASLATRVCELTGEERLTKRRRLDCFRSQAETLAQFGVDQEVFRIAPGYNFGQPPHPGQLFYERFSWGMTGARFCELARLAQGAPNRAGLSLSPA